MQYIRERLSLNLSPDQPTIPDNTPGNQSTVIDVPATVPKPPARKARDGARLSKVTISPTVSNFTEASEYYPDGSLRLNSLGTPSSTYNTPFQSPVSSEKWHPHNETSLPQQELNTDVQHEKRTLPPGAVFVIDHGQISGYPHSHYSTPIMGGYVNHAFANDSGANLNNSAHSSQPQAHVIREQYWTWSCKCRRQFNSREKILLLVICFLLLIIGGLAAYLGINSNDGNPLPGGLLTGGTFT